MTPKHWSLPLTYGGVCMAKRNTSWDTNKLSRWIKEGRGQGEGKEYKPGLLYKIILRWEEQQGYLGGLHSEYTTSSLTLN